MQKVENRPGYFPKQITCGVYSSQTKKGVSPQLFGVYAGIISWKIGEVRSKQSHKRRFGCFFLTIFRQPERIHHFYNLRRDPPNNHLVHHVSKRKTNQNENTTIANKIRCSKFAHDFPHQKVIDSFQGRK